VYRTFVLEARYGFNRTRPGTFVLDRLKTLGLSVVLGIPVLAAVLAFFQYAGRAAWLYSWVLLTLVSLAMQYVAPTWLMPLFNRFEPLAEGSLRDRLLTFAQTVSFPLKSVLVMDGSRRTSKSNAFFTGFGNNRRVVLYDTLISKHSEDELEAIVAHEIGHYKRHHIPILTLTGVLHTGILFFLLSRVLLSRPLFAAVGVAEPSVYIGLVLFGLLYVPAELILSPALNALSRRFEFEADAFAAHSTGRPNALASALKALTVDHLGNLTPHPLYVALHYTHPPLRDRLLALQDVHPTDSSAA
jgi:STE24 endopeptidase